ncbi:MAG TPA: peptidylprolyl isomerase [Sandaracinaceae bacterium LLY-WYZ-13_1]|nr:peptidylprolyl isomerase [Sandaracinaceae bacterium LLY-WYZ-13_1]
MLQRSILRSLPALLVACGGATPAVTEPEARREAAVDPVRCGPVAPTDRGALVVYGRRVPEEQEEAAWRALGFDRLPPERAAQLEVRDHIRRGLVDRELLLYEAEHRGLSFGPMTDVWTRMSQGGALVVVGPEDAPEGYPRGELQVEADGEPVLRRFVRSLGLERDAFVRWQEREELAWRARERLLAEAPVEEAALRQELIRREGYVRLRVLRVSTRAFEPYPLDAEAFEAWRAAHADEVREAYQQHAHRYRDLLPMRRCRHLLIESRPDASDGARAAARARAEELLRRVRGGEDLGALARAHSDDHATAVRGGDLGWARRGSWVEALEDAAFGARRPGPIPRVVRTRFGFHVVELLGIRDAGDVPRVEAEREIARERYRAEVRTERARRAAEEALDRWRGGMPAEDVLDGLVGARAHGPYAPSLEEARVTPADAPSFVPGEGPGEGSGIPPEQLRALVRRLREGDSTEGFSEGPRSYRARGPFAGVFELSEGEWSPAPRADDDHLVLFRVVERYAPAPREVSVEVRESTERDLAEAWLAEHVRGLRDQAEARGCLRGGPRPPSSTRPRTGPRS